MYPGSSVVAAAFVSADWKVASPGYRPEMHETGTKAPQDPPADDVFGCCRSLMSADLAGCRRKAGDAFAFNKMDTSNKEHAVDRRSYGGIYEVVDGLPRCVPDSPFASH